MHRENEEDYARSLAELDALVADAIARVTAQAVTDGEGDGSGAFAVNSTGHARTALVEAADGSAFALVAVPGSGIAPLVAVEPVAPVVTTRADGGTVLDNGLLRVTLDARGLITSIVDLRHADRELVPAGRAANLLQLHEDIPTAWDAWDVDAHYRASRTDLVEAASVSSSRTRLSARPSRSSASSGARASCSGCRCTPTTPGSTRPPTSTGSRTRSSSR